MIPREIIARRIAKEFKDGYLINLGIGLPTMATNYIPENTHVMLQSENGCVGLGSVPKKDEENKYIVDAGGKPVTITEYGAFFNSSISFAMMRGGHVDLTVLGAYQVNEEGDIANWSVPGKKLAGMGGAMDLLVGAKRVIVGMEHTNYGSPKLLKKCTMPITAANVVNRVITEMGVFDIKANGMELIEINTDFSLDDIRASTEAEFSVADNLKPMQI